MGTVLRVLVVVILLLSVGAFLLAFSLFGKRELLIGRTHLLEEGLINVAKTIEAAEPPDAPATRYAAKDISEVTSKELDNPDRSTFWDNYQHKLETANLPTLNYATDDKRLQLRQYYQVGADGKKVLDPLTQKPAVKGKGTMQEMLDQLYDRAKTQDATLNKTRAELTKVRDELVKTIEEVNGLKKQGRTDKKTIEEKQKQIDDLTEQKRALERKIEALEDEKRTLTAELAEVKKEVVKQKDEIETLSKQVKEQAEQIKRLTRPGDRGETAVPAGERLLATLAPGDKGKVVAADNTYKFVVVELAPAFMTELLGPQKSNPLPQLELMIKRAGMKTAAGEFVTRIKLRQVLRDQNLVVADILIDWQQVPVEKGDVVFL